MRYCRFCGAELPTHAHFCGDCGKILPNEINRAGEPFLELLANQAQAPATGVPMVQGAPQLNSIPLVQGTPSVPAHAPAGQLYLPDPAPSAPSAAPNAGSWVPHSLPPQTHHHHASGEMPTVPHKKPHHHTRPRRPRLHGPHRLAWTFIITTVAIVVIVASGLGIFLARFTPSLSLSGSSSVTSGDTLQLHGRNFIPGSSVTLTLDDHIPLTYTRHASAAGASYILTMSLPVSVANQLAQSTTTNSSLAVDGSGNFDVSIQVSENWPLGVHAIHAIDSALGRSAELQFTIKPRQAMLQVMPDMLDFKTVEKGSKAVLAVIVGNAGKQPLRWTADPGTMSWLSVKPNNGTIPPGSLEQTIYVTVDTSQLPVGDYSATLHISSDAGQAQVAVKLHVTSPGSTQQAAQMSVSPDSLDFGTVLQGAKATLQEVISNTGGQPLTWKADTGGAKWLALDSYSGTVRPHTQQTINVTADTSQVGKFGTTLNITSNGGNVQVPVTLVVNAPPPPKVGGAILNGCSYAAGSGWTCTATVTADPGNQADLTWTTGYMGVGGTTFTPSTGMLPPGQSKSVTVSVPDTECPLTNTFTFFGPVNNASVTYSCNPPALTASPGSLDYRTCTSVNNGNSYQCTVTLSETANSEGYVQWSASSKVVSSFSPPNGQLSPGGSVTVTITIPATCVNGNGQGAITFSPALQGTAATVTWSGICIT